VLQTWLIIGVSVAYLGVLFAIAFYGKSNRDIAESLVISERTARTHVSNVLTKLGLASRTQAALWAMREGLVTGP
jgi:DNA-binding NarL/FixJ family response regulator